MTNIAWAKEGSRSSYLAYVDERQVAAIHTYRVPTEISQQARLLPHGDIAASSSYSVSDYARRIDDLEIDVHASCT
jgi:hypothetical protein